MDTATCNGHARAFATFPCHNIVNGRCTCGNPDCDSPGKHPRTLNGLKDATTDKAQHARWRGRWPQANLAIQTDGLVVVDVDPDKGGVESLIALKKEFGPLPETVSVKTGGGGFHFYFVPPSGVKIHSRNGLRPGIDIKAIGGYVIAPPSNHVDGVYEWMAGLSPTDIEIAEIPAAWAEILPRKDRQAVTAGNGSTSQGFDNLQRAQAYVAKASAASEGTRNDAAFRLAGNLAAFGLGEDEIFALLVGWNVRNQPQLDESELRQCVKSALVNGTPREPKEDRRPGMADLRPAEYRDDPQPRKEIVFKRITSAELAEGDYTIRYAIEGAMVEGQPLEIGGPMKTLKTSVLCDAAISLESAGYFLGRFKVNRQYRVGVMSGESGMGSLQEIANRACKAAGKNLADLKNLIWSPDIPKLNSADHLEALDKFIAADGIEVLFIDPAYLCMPSTDAGNLMAQGELLRNVNDVCQPRGVTLVICHHTKRSTRQDAYEPLEVQHLAWAGHAEFARQWWMLNRRERYLPGTGEHRLWLSVGGSAGHSSLWAVDVSEGSIDDPGGRRWDVSLTDAAGARDADTERKQIAKRQDQERRIEADSEAICKALAALPGMVGTKTDIKDATTLNEGRFKPAFAAMLLDKRLTPTTITKGNKQTYEAYKFAS